MRQEEEERDGACDVERRGAGPNGQAGAAGGQRVLPARRRAGRVPGPDAGVVAVPVEGRGPLLHRPGRRAGEQERFLVLPASQPAGAEDQEPRGVLERGPGRPGGGQSRDSMSYAAAPAGRGPPRPVPRPPPDPPACPPPLPPPPPRPPPPPPPP